jgi:hypothetical protein
MLNDHEVKRIFEVITDYKELTPQSSSTRDQLDSLQHRWNGLSQLLPPPSFQRDPDFPELKWWQEVSLVDLQGAEQ